MKLGEYLRKIRKENKKTLVRLAEETGLSHSYLSQVENGIKANPSMETLRKIAKACNHSHLDLWGKAGYMSEEEIMKQEAMIKETHSQLDEMFKEHGAYLTPENKEILDKEKLIDKHGYIPQEELQKQKEIIETKTEKPAMFAGDDILYNIKSNPNVSLNMKPLKHEDRKRMEDLLKAAFPEYFK